MGAEMLGLNRAVIGLGRDFVRAMHTLLNDGDFNCSEREESLKEF